MPARSDLGCAGVSSLSLPALVPEMDALAGDAELASDLGLADADGVQLAGSQPTRLEPLALVSCRWAASDSRHGADPDRQGPPPSNPPRQTNTQNPLYKRWWRMNRNPRGGFHLPRGNLYAQLLGPAHLGRFAAARPC